VGLRFRKSFNFNGFKVNFSKTGVGYSYGIPGFRYTVTADGRERVTVSIPGAGISYVDESSTKKRQDSELERAIASGNYKTIQNASVDKLISPEYQEFLSECNTYLKNWNLFVKLRLACLIVAVLSLLIAIIYSSYIFFGALTVGTGVFALFCHSTLMGLKNNKIKMNYAFDCTPNPSTELVDLMENTKRSQMIQGASSVITNAISRVHAGASNLYDTAIISVQKQAPIFLETNVCCYSIKSNNQTLYILPDKILVVDGNSVGAVSVDSVEMTYSTSNFHELGSVANDATIIGHTYQYVNNNGTPDRRYKDNREIPICLYGELVVTSKEGLNMKFFCSNAKCTENFYYKFMDIKNRKKQESSKKQHNQQADAQPQKQNPNNINKEQPEKAEKIVINKPLDVIIKEKSKGEILYEGDDDHVRFMLGEAGNNPIICFGINPSTANDIEDDPTISRIKKIAAENNFDGWVMLNLYPQRATNPDDIHKEADKALILKNVEIIRSVFKAYPDALILASWGDAIEKRNYLKDCLEAIISIDYDRRWVCRGELTSKGNPRHQLYVANNTPLKDLIFDADGNVLGSYDRN
jgi:serine/threonine protein phosphatase 1